MSWGKGIVLAFIGFAVFIGILVTVCVRQQINLVSKDYYQEELRYQDRIDELNNALALESKPAIVIDRKHIRVTGIRRGQLTLLRPSDPQFDLAIAVDSLTSFDLSKYPAGRYNASLQWESNGRKYLIREQINL